MSNDKKIKIGEVGIYDARQLGIPRMLILGIQHTFAMFGATVLVPILTGLDVSTTLLMAGLYPFVPSDHQRKSSCISGLFFRFSWWIFRSSSSSC